MKFTSKLFEYDNSFFNPLELSVGKIFQVAELSLIRGGEIAEHIQHCDEITYAISGKATIFSGEEQSELKSGQIHFIKKGMKHKIISDMDENFRYICIGIIPNRDFGDISEYINITENKPHYILNDDGDIRILSEMLINEFYKRDNMSNTMISLYISQILISLYRLLENTSDMKAVKESTSTSNFTLYHTLRFIDREYMNIESVKSIAETLSYSEYYLSHLFREKMGISIKQYILAKKLTAASELLKTSNLTVGEIATHLGFSSQHTFSQAFKRLFGKSPTDFKTDNNRKF